MLVVLGFSFSCSTARFVEPLKAKEIAVGINVGGPIIDFAGATIPIPLSAAFVGYGVTENHTAFGALHLTSLLYKTVQIEVGTRSSLYRSEGWIPSVSGLVALHTNVSLRDGQYRVFPEVNLTPYWNYKGWHSYVNGIFMMDTYFNKQQDKSFFERFVPALAIGQQYNYKKWTFGLEYKRLAHQLNSDVSVVAYKTIHGYGAHGIYLQAFKRF